MKIVKNSEILLYFRLKSMLLFFSEISIVPFL